MLRILRTTKLRYGVFALTVLICFTLASIIYINTVLLLRKHPILGVGDGTKRQFMQQEFKNREFNFESSDEYFRKERTINGIDCGKLQVDNTPRQSRDTLRQSRDLMSRVSLFSERNPPNTCAALTAGYVNSSLTGLEEAFPIAYSIVMYRDTAQVWMLLQAIYRPQNTYCIHIDKKSRPGVWAAMKNLVRCLDNVFLSSRSVSVRWGAYSVLEAGLICMQDLWNNSTTWRYLINLTGQEFPLKTNYELVKILTAYNGANDVDGTITNRIPGRWAEAGEPPDDLIPVKGETHVVLNRKFVEYVLKEAIAKRLLDWSRKVEVPDEVFFSTLNFNPKLKLSGSFWSDNVSLIEAKPFLARYKIWKYDHALCAGKYVRDICILNVGDLQRLSKSKALFANKFHWPRAGSKVAEYCQSEVIYNRTKQQYFGTITFNDTYYRNLDFVKFQIK